MNKNILGWIPLISVAIITLFGYSIYFSLLMYIIYFLCGVLTVLYFTFDTKSIFPYDLELLDNPLDETNFSIDLPDVMKEFNAAEQSHQFDKRITGSEIVDSFLNEIINVIISDYVKPWYQIVTADEKFTNVALKQTVIAASANLSNRVKVVNWVPFLSNRVLDEVTIHLKLFKKARSKLKQSTLTATNETSNSSSKLSPKRFDRKKPSHRRNKSETDAVWYTDFQKTNSQETSNEAKSKTLPGISSQLTNLNLVDLFFDLEALMEEHTICRDVICTNKEKENEILHEISEAVLYLIVPPKTWQCHSAKLILTDLLTNLVLKPLIEVLSDPDNINRVIIRMCCRDNGLPSELFLNVLRSTEDIDEIDATNEFVQKEIQKLHSRDSGGECELSVRRQLSSLHYLTRLLSSRRARISPPIITTSNDVTSSPSKSSFKTETDEEAKIYQSHKFLAAICDWKSNAQLELEYRDIEAVKSDDLIEKLQISALELCHKYMHPCNILPVGVTEALFIEVVNKIKIAGIMSFKILTCFDEVEKIVVEALGEYQPIATPIWQTQLFTDVDIDNSSSDSNWNIRSNKESSSENNLSVGGILAKILAKKIFANIPPEDVVIKRNLGHGPEEYTNNPTRHIRSRSEVPSVVSKQNENGLSGEVTPLTMADVKKSFTDGVSQITARIIETGLVQEKGRTFGIYAIAVTRKHGNQTDIWHVYRRYSDFYDLHCSIKQQWPELSHLPFPGKKTFQNTSRNVLERRMIMLNAYLDSLSSFSKEPKYRSLMSEQLLGGFLCQETHNEKQSNSIDAMVVSSIRAGMRTLKNMPDQLVHTVDGVMDGISKVFQGKLPDQMTPEILKSALDMNDNDGDDTVAFRLLEEVLEIKGLWLRRRLLAPLRTLLADRANKKVLEYVSSMTSPKNVVQYLQYMKAWLDKKEKNSETVPRENNTFARTRVAAKVALLSACSDDLKHIVGSDSVHRGLLTVFELFQKREINKRLLYILMEATLVSLFHENNFPDLFKRLYSSSSRVEPIKKSYNK